jgi:hypothetical protein
MVRSDGLFFSEARNQIDDNAENILPSHRPIRFWKKLPSANWKYIKVLVFPSSTAAWKISKRPLMTEICPCCCVARLGALMTWCQTPVG